MDLSNIAINPETGNPQSRILPDHKVKEIYARNGMVVVVATVGDKDVATEITRPEAINRAKAINEMIPGMRYASDVQEHQRLVEMFMEAIIKAKGQDGGTYTSFAVKQAIASTDPRDPLFTDTKPGASMPSLDASEDVSNDDSQGSIILPP
jgi:hypothetical protein